MTATSGLPEREPAAVGMSSARLSTIDRVVQRGVDAGGYPGAAVVVGRKGYSVLSRGFGALDWTGRARVSSQESIYDLASLTKVVATTTAIMVLYDAGKVDIDAPVSRYLPDFSGGLRDQVTGVLTRYDGAVQRNQQLHDRITEIQSGVITANTNALANFYAERTLTRQPITPADQAEAYFLLVGNRLSKTTGQVIAVDGGRSINI